MLSRLFIAALWSPVGKGLTSWLLFVMFNCVFVTFQCGILCQAGYLIVSISDLCRISYVNNNLTRLTERQVMMTTSQLMGYFKRKPIDILTDQLTFFYIYKCIYLFCYLFFYFCWCIVCHPTNLPSWPLLTESSIWRKKETWTSGACRQRSPLLNFWNMANFFEKLINTCIDCKIYRKIQ